DNAAAAVHQRPAGVPGVEGRVRLNHVVHQVASYAPQGPADSADDSCCHGGLEAERAADRHDELADPQLRRVAKLGEWERLPVALDEGQVGPRVVADDAATDLLAIVQADADLLRLPNHVVVGEQVALRGEQDAGPGAHLTAPPDAQVHHG